MKIRISDLYIQQKQIFLKYLERADVNVEPISIFDLDGKWVVSDGNHRVFVAMMKKKEYVFAKVFNNRFPEDKKPEVISVREWFDKQIKSLK